MKNIYVLGLCYSHDASACLLKNGVPVVAIQKERLSRKKHDGSITDIDLRDCIEYCLGAEKITLSQIDLVVENSPTVLYCKEKNNVLGFKRARLLDKINSKKIIQVSHHLAHAYCAYGLSNFGECAVIVVDGQGNYKEDITEDLGGAVIYPKNSESSYIERESFYKFSKGGYKVVRKNLSNIHKSFVRLSGLGHLYESVSSYVFRSRFDAGKLMGLAPYGKENSAFKMLSIKSGAEIKYHNDWVGDFMHPNRDASCLERYFNEYANLACRVQKDLEKAILALSRWFRVSTGLNSLAYSGGVALNCSSNAEILNKSGFKDIFITPPASDCGVSMGCAFYGYLKVLEKEKKEINYLDYLGKTYSEQDILNAIKKNKNKIVFYKSKNIFKEAAGLISKGKVIGWFQGGSEFGPRALGNRSIIADPRNPKMKDIINLGIKKRDSFRPFAPSVLEENAQDFFDVSYSPYMLLTSKAKQNIRKEIPAVVHVDGTSRIQTVNERQNQRYYQLIKEFYVLTNIPMVLNTSFNGNDEPIVETPDDAINSLFKNGLDALCLGDYIVKIADNDRTNRNV